MRLGLLIAISLVLVGCAREVVDGAPLDGHAFDVTQVIPAEPRLEPRSAYGNHSPYEVFGRRYEVKDSSEGYVERGIASWYGTLFHGRLTSSGEPYDLYQMTAAHKTLPLPTYVEVEHLGTGQIIVVRVNDRGPFVDDRIIDLSWAAAVKLGMDQAGLAPVEVRAISFDQPQPRIARPARVPVMVQVAAFSDRERAEQTAGSLRAQLDRPVQVAHARTRNGSLWRVQLGPLSDTELAIAIKAQIESLGFEGIRYVYP